MPAQDSEGREDQRVLGVAIAVLIVLVLGCCNLAHADPGGGTPPSPSSSNKEECQVMWTDFFPLPTVERQYGPEVFQELKLEACSYDWFRSVTIYRRIYQEIYTKDQVEHKIITPWKPVEELFIYPFKPGDPLPKNPLGPGEQYPG